LETFGEQIAGSLLDVFIDNDGVLGSVIRGSSVADDLSMVVGHTWLLCYRLRLKVCWLRVESGANYADMPSRLMGELTQPEWLALSAVFVEPRLPKFVWNLWSL
jgi:hypothetical protein